MKQTDEVIYEEDDQPGPLARWLPPVVVIGAVVGFVWLAWYAYHAGSQSIKEEDLLVVEADKTPVKEKPADPGGMKVPNQDKTVFETFGGNAQATPKVERVLPAPEEPVVHDEAKTDEMAAALAEQKPSSGKEQLIGDDGNKDVKALREEKPAEAPHHEEVKPAEAAKLEEKPAAQEIKEVPVATTATRVAAPEKPIKLAEKPVAEKVAAEKPAKPQAKPGNGIGKVQLGAFRSESEAHAAWAKMRKAHGELAAYQPNIVKADLGAKGIYYRLRLGGFSDIPAAKSFCAKLAAKGQNCIPVSGN